jgi:carbon monoxide dehydrogenase subunit G
VRQLKFLVLLAAVPLFAQSYTPWFSERGVHVDIARSKDATPWVRGTFELPVPPAKVISVVTDYKRYKEIFAPALERANVLETSASGTRIHLVWPYPSPLRDRDAVVTYKLVRSPAGGAVLSWRGEAKPDDPKKGVRIEHVEGETRIEATATGTRVVYSYFGDLGGNFPSSLEERVWKGEPIGYMQALRRALGLPILKK